MDLLQYYVFQWYMNVVFPTSSFSKVRFIALCHLLRREEKQEQHNAYLLLRTIFERAVETSFKNNYRTSSWKVFTSLNGALKHSSKYHPFFSKFLLAQVLERVLGSWPLGAAMWPRSWNVTLNVKRIWSIIFQVVRVAVLKFRCCFWSFILY